jgi:hypothetical protein
LTSAAIGEERMKITPNYGSIPGLYVMFHGTTVS